MIDFLFRVILPQRDRLAITLHSGVDVYVGQVNNSTVAPFLDSWLSMISKGRIFARVQLGAFGAYTVAVDLVTCEATPGTYFFDGDGTGGDLYIHFVGVTDYSSGWSIIGEERGFSLNKPVELDGVVYDPRIISPVPIRYKGDNRAAGAMVFTDQKIVLRNSDAVLDEFINRPLPGSRGTLLLYDDAEDDFLEFYTGTIRGDESTVDTTTIDMIDIRRAEDLQVPSDVIDSDTYPGAPEDSLNKIIPDGYGEIKGGIAYAINATTRRKFAQTATSLDAVWYKDGDVWEPAQFSNVDLVNGEFDSTDSVQGSGFREMRVDGVFRPETNPGDIIKDLNARYLGISYDADNYNIAEFESEAAKLDPVYLYLDENKDYFDWLEELQNGSTSLFSYLIDGDGRRTIRVVDQFRETTRQYLFFENKDDLLPIRRDFRSVAGTIRVNYDEDLRFETTKQVVDEIYKPIVEQVYGIARERIADSLLRDQALAEIRARNIAFNFWDAFPDYKFEIHVEKLSELDIRLFDILLLDLERPTGVVSTPVGNVGNIIIDRAGPDSFTIDASDPDSFTIGFPEFIDTTVEFGRRYYGNVRGVVVGIEYNPDTLTYTLLTRGIQTFTLPGSGVAYGRLRP